MSKDKEWKYEIIIVIIIIVYNFMSREAFKVKLLKLIKFIIGNV